MIPNDGVFVVADMDADGLTSVVDVDLLANFDFQNGPDSIVLMDMGTAIDSVGYGIFAPGEIFAGEGTPAADAPAGSSLAREFAEVVASSCADEAVLVGHPQGRHQTRYGVAYVTRFQMLMRLYCNQLQACPCAGTSKKTAHQARSTRPA